MDTQTKTGLAIAVALVAAFVLGGIAFTFAGGAMRAFGTMHDGAPFATSAVRAYDHGPMMDGYGRFGVAERPRGEGMRFAPQGEIPEGFVPPCGQDGAAYPYEGECPLQSGI